MKTIVTLALLVSASAFSYFGRTITEEPTIVTTQGVKVKVSNFCVNGDKFETKTPVEYCKRSERVWVQDNGSGRRSDGHYDYKCVETAVEKLTHPVNYMRAICNREILRDSDDRYLGPCEYTYEPATLALSYTFPVYKVTGRITDVDLNTGEAVRKVGNKTVEVNECK